MIDRYSRPGMSAVFTDAARMRNWLEVERAALAALVAEGIAPQSALDGLAHMTEVDVAAVQAREAEIHHDLAAFVDVVAAEAPEAGGWLHYGLTSSDVVDTALALQLREAGRIVLGGIAGLRAAVLRRAHEHRDTVMLGRTHGMPAETITFGAKLAGWWHQLGRDEARVHDALLEVEVGKLSGAVGMYSGVSPAVEARVLRSLGLGRDPSATQIVQRDRHAALLGALAVLASTLDRIAVEVRHLQRADVAEASEAFGRSQKGSSAMPHKRNPIVSEQISGLARVIRANADVALQNVVLWHERDISHSSAERVIFPDTFLLTDYLLAKAIWLVDGLEVHVDRMQLNIASQRGLVASQRVLLALIEAGAVRDDAYRAVQEAAHRVLDPLDATAVDLATALAADERVTGSLDAARLSELTDPDFIPPGVAAIFAELEAAGGALPAT
ncbi:MAG: adenylosuccinate lyase [Thermoleophilia bacterium]|nr:adenylosuccinate lyase [Thermoleophilia bacterium]